VSRSKTISCARRREFRGRRWLRVGLRSLHLLGVSFYVGGAAVGASADTLSPWFIASIASGVGMFATDLIRSFAVLAEVRGQVILLKLVALGVAHGMPAYRTVLLGAVVVASALISHMPGRYRHWVIGDGPPDAEREAAGRG